MFGDGLPSWADGRHLAPGAGTLVTSIKDDSTTRNAPGWSSSTFTLMCYYLDINGSLTTIDCEEKRAKIGYVCTRRKREIYKAPMKVSFLVYQQTVACTEQAITAQWPDGWSEPKSRATDTPHCYLFAPRSSTMSWFDRKRACQQLGGDLAVIENSIEFGWIHNKIVEILGSQYFCWSLNGHRSMYGNGFTWANGNPITSYGVWWPGFPWDHLRLSDCGYYCFNPNSTNKGWVNYPCMLDKTPWSRAPAYICKRPKCDPNINPAQEVCANQSSSPINCINSSGIPLRAMNASNTTIFRLAKWNAGKNCVGETFLRLRCDDKCDTGQP